MVEIVQNQEHRPLKQSLDYAYIQAIYSAAELEGDLYNNIKGKNLRIAFSEFVKAFSALFRMTGYKATISDHRHYQEIATEAGAWLAAVPASKETYVTQKKAQEGLRLFTEWQKVLERAGVIKET